MAWEYLRQWGSWRHTDGDRCLISEAQYRSADMRCPVCGGAGPLSQTVRINAPGRPFELATVAEANAMFDPVLTEISTRYLADRVFPAVQQRSRAKREAAPEPAPRSMCRYDLEDE